jgi:hypothetical protein
VVKAKVRTVALGLAVAGTLAGCEKLIGIEGTALEPDAPRADGPPGVPDAMPDAAPPSVDVGNGADGPLTVAAVAFTDDVRIDLDRSVGIGSTLLEVAAVAGFGLDDEILIMQMTGPTAGHYETRRVAQLDVGKIYLDAALSANFDADTAITQLIRIPNYTTVTIPAGARLTARPWDGATGGVVFFRATDGVTIAAGGAIDGDGIGGAGGAASAATAGGARGLGGNGGARLDCAVCGLGMHNAENGGWGQNTSTPGAAGADGVDYSGCHSGDGGKGALAGFAPEAPVPSGLGAGPGGGASPSAAGSNLSADMRHPTLGGGGAGGQGGIGGVGGGGGGGAGGQISAGSSPGGGPGTAGFAGGDGGSAGAGGAGGGVIIVHASSISLDGSISAAGIAGGAGTDGAMGGAGGDGGYPGATQTCSSAYMPGGRGGGGGGGGGGAGGGGGGGGAGGVIVLNAAVLQLDGFVHGLAGAGTAATAGGPGGAGGDGFGGLGQTGPSGEPGLAGGAGGTGFVYINFIESCGGCETAADPAAQVSDLP